jgi:hypothetical protein
MWPPATRGAAASSGGRPGQVVPLNAQAFASPSSHSTVGCQRRAGVVFPHICPSPSAPAHLSMSSRRPRGPYTSSAALYTDGRVAGRTAQSVAPREGVGCAAANVLSMLPARACVSPTRAAGELLLDPYQPPPRRGKAPVTRWISAACLRGVSGHDTPTHARDGTCTSVRTREAPSPQHSDANGMVDRAHETLSQRACTVTAIHERVVFGNTVGVAQGRTLHRVGGESV